MAYNFNEIPNELKQLSQWVLWKYEERNGKKTKIPCQPDKTLAQANNRNTWSTFATVEKFYNMSDFDGIGFVFSKNDEYMGVDIDHCMTDGKLNDFPKEVIEALDSYTEFSPSGNGIHIIVKGTPPNGIKGTGRKNVKHGLEIYSYGRFFTFTGDRENENPIFERSDELQEVFDKYFDDSDIKDRKIILSDYEKDEIRLSNSEIWEKMFQSKSGREIKILFDGESLTGDHSSDDLSLCNHLAFWTGKSANRMDAMFKESGQYREKWDTIHFGDTGETYGERTIAKAIATTPTTILDNEKEFQDFTLSYSLPQIEGEEENGEPKKEESSELDFYLSELGNAERIASEYGEIIKYVPGLRWVIWDGKRWKVDEKKEIERIVAKVLRKLHKVKDPIVQKWAKQCEKRSVRTNTTNDLIALVPGEMSDFDKDKYLFNVANGVIDLRTGDLLPHKLKYQITKISNVVFNPQAKCPNWEAFLESIFLGDKELIEYIQRLIGYTLTGEISEQSMYFFVGGGSNGKSTFVNTIKELMGEYGRQAKSDTFIKKRDSGANSDIARLSGSRFVSAVESEANEKLAESLVKQVTGGEPVLARFMHKDFFEYTPEFKVFFTTNHKPLVGGIDDGIWRRIKMIPFKLSLPAEKRDKNLNNKLLEELPGILNWAVEGCKKWQTDGMKEPSIVSNATKDYKEEMDILAPFLEERCIVDGVPGSSRRIKVEAKELYGEYENYCYTSGDISLGNNRAFYREMQTKGFIRERGSQNKYFIYGIDLRKNMNENDLKNKENKPFIFS